MRTHPLRRFAFARRRACQDIIKRGDVCAVVLHVLRERSYVRCAPVIKMIANRPHRTGNRTEIRYLLWHPPHSTPADIRKTEIAVANDIHSKLRQQADGCGVERMPWRNPDARRDPFALEDLDRAP